MCGWIGPAQRFGKAWLKGGWCGLGGDRDAIRNEQLLEMHDNIPGSLLCILPGTTHFPYEDRTRWFLEILYDFFDNPQRRTTTAQLFAGQKF